MTSEDWIFKFDPMNYDSELEYVLNEGILTYSDCFQAFKSGDMNADEFDYCRNFFKERLKINEV